MKFSELHQRCLDLLGPDADLFTEEDLHAMAQAALLTMNPLNITFVYSFDELLDDIGLVLPR